MAREYVETKSSTFRILTDGIDFRVQYRRFGRWKWLERYDFSVWGTDIAIANFQNFADAESEIRRVFGERIVIVHEFHPVFNGEICG